MSTWHFARMFGFHGLALHFRSYSQVVQNSPHRHILVLTVPATTDATLEVIHQRKRRSTMLSFSRIFSPRHPHCPHAFFRSVTQRNVAALHGWSGSRKVDSILPETERCVRSCDDEEWLASDPGGSRASCWERKRGRLAEQVWVMAGDVMPRAQNIAQPGDSYTSKLPQHIDPESISYEQPSGQTLSPRSGTSCFSQQS